MIRRLWVPAMGAAIGMLAACGSTIQMGAAQTSAAGGEFTVPTTATATATQSPESSSVSSLPGRSIGQVTTVRGPATATSIPTQPGHVPRSASPVATSALPPGPITIGVPYLDSGSTNTLTAAIGKGLAANDPKALMSAYLANLNAHGGVLGHQIEASYLSLNPYGQTDQLDQQACSHFTEDVKVSVVLGQQLGTSLYSCLSKAGVAVIDGSIGPELSTRQFDEAPLLIMPDNVALDRLARVMVPRLIADKFIGASSDKLGVLYYDNEQSSVDGLHALESAMAAHGLKVADAFGITKGSSDAGLAAMEAAVQGAELRFRVEGINRVMCVEATPWMCGFFPLYSGTQGYYPRYAFQSEQNLSAIISNDPVKEMIGAVAVGWLPATDLQSLSAMPASTLECLAFFRKHSFPIVTANEKGGAVQVCTEVNLLAAAVAKAPALTGAGVVQGASQLGTSFDPIGTFGIDISSAHRDGPTLFRDMQFSAGCDCFRYTSRPRAG
ncbi:MAG TPA: hypothetical protein VG899_05085 [Mycobacteriales bacterium]|nr:hypothetical protein [Mycobacteriales bacterium]